MGLMIRFSAPEEEIASLLRFITRRSMRSGEAPDGEAVLIPLDARMRDELRPRRTALPLLRRLRQCDSPIAWGIHVGDGDPCVVATRGSDGHLRVDPEASHLIVLLIGPVHGPERRREAVIEARDWPIGDPADIAGEEKAVTAREVDAARRLMERCTRRIRRRGALRDGRWYL